MKRHHNHGLRKICGCPRRLWPKCDHGWHLNFWHDGKGYRFSLDRRAGRHLTSKTEALAEADVIRTAVRMGTFGQAVSTPQTLTVEELGRLYFDRYIKVHRKASVKEEQYRMNRLCRTVVPGPNGAPHPFGSWSAAVVTAGDLDAYRGIVLSKSRGIRGGTVSVNRCLGLLRAMFNWAVLKGYVERTPFKVGTVTAVRMLKETPRHRRLEPGEKERLLAEAGPHLRALIVAALETCCRQGELLSLQLRQVKWERSELHFPADKTKARRERFIPISQRLQALHEMRRHGPDGRVFGPDAYVFGDEIGARVGSIKTAWRATCRRAGIEDLNFHDLRREAGSRLLEGGMPEHYVQRFLDHANLSTTSRYLATTRRGMHQVFKCSGNTSKGRRRKLEKFASYLQEMETELLYAKVDQLEAGSPLARRRSTR